MDDGVVSLACQFGRCGECPERDLADADAECICECHIDDDDSDEARDWRDEVRAHAVYGSTPG